MDPERGPWAISGDEVVKLQGPELNRDREKLARELRLCQQMLRCLDPARLLATLEDPSPVRTSDLEITKRLSFSGCTVVDGVVDGFPLYTADGLGKSQVTLFVHADSKRLLAVNAVRLDEDGKPRAAAELVLLQDYVEVGGMQLPSRLTIYGLAASGREPVMTVHIMGIDLRRQFGPEHFARPRSVAEARRGAPR
jgi:hypothetical protein